MHVMIEVGNTLYGRRPCAREERPTRKCLGKKIGAIHPVGGMGALDLGSIEGNRF